MNSQGVLVGEGEWPQAGTVLMPTDMDGIPGALRAQRYRQFAAETIRLARATDAPEIRTTYLSLAACWKKLAEKADVFSADDDPVECDEPALDGHRRGS